MDSREGLRLAGTLILVALLVLGSGVVAYDPDQDGLWTHEELQQGTDPFDRDTDGDEVPDGVEVREGSSPVKTDTDGDGLSDTIEYYGHGPGETLSITGETIETREQTAVPWVWEFDESDPTDPDTDGDGIPDGVEYEAGLNPTKVDSDEDGLPDPVERDGPTDAADPDTDGDNLLDGWEVAGRTESGAPLPGADPLHKDIYLVTLSLPGTENEPPAAAFAQAATWFGEMPVENPDGETGIRLHHTAGLSTNRSIDPWTKANGESTRTVSGYMAMREFYNEETIGPRTGSYFLTVYSGEASIGGAGNAGGTKVSIVRSYHGNTGRWARILTHELLHNVVRDVSDGTCVNSLHTCNGFLSYENETYLSEPAAAKLNEQGFADPVYENQMNATSCADTISDPSECGA